MTLFLGVPYTRSPLKGLRWRPPQSLNTSFSGTKEATAYPSNCIGLGSETWSYPISEDWMYVNVVRPHGHDKEEDGLSPIAVWIHGGGFYMGGSGDLLFNMSFIVENGQKEDTPFIPISLNYRLIGFEYLYSNEDHGEGGTTVFVTNVWLCIEYVLPCPLSFRFC